MKRIALALSVFCAVPMLAQSPTSVRRSALSRPTIAEAERFIAQAEKDLAAKSTKSSRAGWVAANFITDDTEEMSAEAQREYNVAVQQYALRASRFDRLKLSATSRRKLMLLKLALSAPPPSNPDEATELVRLSVGLEAEYGKGTYCRPAKEAGKPQECLQINDLSRILATSRDPKELLEAWTGWHTISRQMRPRYARFVELSNKGSRELGFANTGAMWRAGYDMDPDAFSGELERIWKQVEPLYLSLHAYTRAKLVDKYGASVVPPNGMIPGHLLGNMWAQEWGNIYDIVAPSGVPAGFDLTNLLTTRKVDAQGMVKYGENFFTSLGFAPLPETFWKRSLLVKPRDREVVCHASAWDIDSKDDIRIKACFEPNAEDFVTAHHELGHSFYQRAYKDQPFLLQNGANDGFHEAIGDAVALSINATYLKQVGLLETPPSSAGDTAFLLRQAMDKVAFLPFGLLIDQWRWKVFSGEVKPADYNKAWWDLRNKYQGIAAPVARTETDFDPGAKFHIPGNTPYTRYFLARVLQFQFYRAMCREAGHTGPLYTCSFYNSKAAGAKLASMLEAGQSRPWQEILFTMTGERQMDGNALLEYFQPLKVWLDRQNQGKPIGWSVRAGG